MASSPKTVAIVYGSIEGAWHGKKFRQTLASAGYKHTADAQNADIVVAHSGGCMLVPLDKSSQTTMLIDPTYWPGNKPWHQGAHKISADFRHYFKKDGFKYFVRHLWAVWYLATDWGHTRELVKAARQFDMPNSTPVPAGPTILVRNDDDPWCTPDLKELSQTHPNIRIVQLPGEHDDCWFNPEPYVSLLQSKDDEHHA